jgi:hypothetical protein
MGQDCYINDDMMKQEREIQATIRKHAREEKENGNAVKVGYQKIMINNQWESILLTIMFHVPMGRFQFSTIVPFNSCVFFRC